MTSKSPKPLALVTGVGPGTGSAVVRRFAQGGYRVAMLARDAKRLAALEHDIPDTIAVPCDVTDPAALEQAIATVGMPQVVVHNAVGGAFGSFMEVEPATLQKNFDINTMALYHLARLTTPAMVKAGEGALIVTGNTSAQRGSASVCRMQRTTSSSRRHQSRARSGTWRSSPAMPGRS